MVWQDACHINAVFWYQNCGIHNRPDLVGGTRFFGCASRPHELPKTPNLCSPFAWWTGWPAPPVPHRPYLLSYSASRRSRRCRSARCRLSSLSLPMRKAPPSASTHAARPRKRSLGSHTFPLRSSRARCMTARRIRCCSATLPRQVSRRAHGAYNCTPCARRASAMRVPRICLSLWMMACGTCICAGLLRHHHAHDQPAQPQGQGQDGSARVPCSRTWVLTTATTTRATTSPQSPPTSTRRSSK